MFRDYMDPSEDPAFSEVSLEPGFTSDAKTRKEMSSRACNLNQNQAHEESPATRPSKLTSACTCTSTIC